MTEEEFQKFKQWIAEYTAKVRQTPETARLSLVRNGLYRADGVLHENYGGPVMTDDEKEQFHYDQTMAEQRLRELLL